MDTNFGKLLSLFYTFLNYSLVGTLVVYCKTAALIKTIYIYCYSNSTVFKLCINNAQYFCRCFNAFANNHKIEPFNSNWISSTVLLDDNTKDKIVSYIETYDDIENPDNEQLENVQYICNNMAGLGNDILDYLVIVKQDDNYSCYVKNPTKLIDMLHNSTVNFLCIIYNHPNMKRPIYIELKISYFIVNNEILSAVFIKRYLAYQHEKYVFNMNYTLTIIDNNLKEITLTSKQYILLNETNYDIITRP